MTTNTDQPAETKESKRRSKRQSQSESTLPAWKSNSKLTATTLTAVINAARKGVSRRKIEEVQKMGSLSKQEMASALHMSLRSLYPVSAKSTTQKDSLDTGNSERLLLLEQLIMHGLQVFDGDSRSLSLWLRSPLPELSLTTEDVIDGPPLPIQEMGRLDEPYFMAGGSPDPVKEQSATPFTPQTPLQMLDTVSGYSLVDAVLSRIEWGIYS